MPKQKDIEQLTPARKRAYRAIFTLYKEAGSSPSQPEIAAKSGITLGNLNPIIYWLEQNQWIRRRPRQHRSIVPLVNLPKGERKSA